MIQAYFKNLGIVKIYKSKKGWNAVFPNKDYTKIYDNPYELLLDLSPEAANAFTNECLNKLEQIIKERQIRTNN